MQTNFNLVLTGQALDAVMNALSTQPYREVAGLIAEIDRQVRAQMEPSTPRLTEAQSEPLPVV